MSMSAAPSQVDPTVFNILQEDPGKVDYSSIGGLSEQIRELRESVELPLMNPELFLRVGIKPPKGVLLYGPPGAASQGARKGGPVPPGCHMHACHACAPKRAQWRKAGLLEHPPPPAARYPRGAQSRWWPAP